MSGYVEFPFPAFGGLNLRDTPELLPKGSAADLLNVSLAEHGSVKVRGGFTYREDSGPSTMGDAVSAREVLLGAGTYIVVAHELGLYGEAGGTAYSVPGLAFRSQRVMEVMGTVGDDELYVANGGGQEVRRLRHGIGWDIPLTKLDGTGLVDKPFGRPSLLGRTADGRMLMGGYPRGAFGPNNLVVDPTMIYATDPYNPQNVGSTNFFRVGSADDDAPTAIVFWRELTFIFTRNSFTVLTGISANESGNPLFHRRPVDAGQGARHQAAVTVAPDGVYFVGTDGVYKTTGGPPTRVSELLGREFFHSSGAISPLYTGPRAQWGTEELHYHGQRLYLNLPTTSNSLPGQLRLDLATGQWVVWTIPAATLFTTRSGDLAFCDLQPGGGLRAAVWNGPRDLLASSDFASLTSGVRAPTPYNAYWRSGWHEFDAGLTQLVQRKLWATGQPFLDVYKDDGTAHQTIPRWVPSDGREVGLSRYGRRAQRHAFRLRGLVAASGVNSQNAWSVHRMTEHVRSTRGTPLP